MFVKILGFDVRWMVTSSGCIPLGALATRGAPTTCHIDDLGMAGSEASPVQRVLGN